MVPRTHFAVFALGLLLLPLLVPAQETPPAPDPAKAPAPPQPGPAPPSEAGPPVPAQPGAERIEGTLVNQGGPFSTLFQAGYFALDIRSYSSDEEAKACFEALRGGGQKALLKKLWKIKEVGYFKVSGSLGYPLVLIRSQPTPDGRVIRAITNRPIAPQEFGTRSEDYPFGYIEIFVPTEGKGTGTLIPMAEITFTEKATLTVESYGTMPFRLIEVDVKKPGENKK